MDDAKKGAGKSSEALTGRGEHVDIPPVIREEYWGRYGRGAGRSSEALVGRGERVGDISSVVYGDRSWGDYYTNMWELMKAIKYRLMSSRNTADSIGYYLNRIKT